MSLADLRKEYRHASLNETEVAANPISQFSLWFDEAVKAGIAEPNAMSVATVSADGRPSSRILLIKGVDQRGFSWFTNYASRKGQELDHKPHAALLFHWTELERQVRIEGRVEKLSALENDEYFHSRPLGSRIGAIASLQSQPIASRTVLEAQFAAAELEHGTAPVRPAHWGGYLLRPERMEFWQGRQSRLHDRLVFILQPDGQWLPQRLQP